MTETALILRPADGEFARYTRLEHFDCGHVWYINGRVPDPFTCPKCGSVQTFTPWWKRPLTPAARRGD